MTTPTPTPTPTLTYEAFLDEVTTILTERYDLDDASAIKLVVDAQAADYFTVHDDREEMRTVEQADKDAVALYEQKQNRVKTHEKQQQRVRQKK
ncbi:MAG: hypothetical protein M3Y65_26095 [Pseudomonadota bacterium]|nr:hypothetical protein [Pseudomonadota bacterium]